MSHRYSRRTILKTAAYAGAALPLAAPRLLRAQSANEKLNIAIVGTHNQARFSIENTVRENFVAFADVDSNFLAKAKLDFPAANTYGDYRIMFDKEQKNIDAAIIAIPDHHHAHAALRAMALGKHCYCEKPLAHSVQEVRLMSEMAARNKLATQMGTQIHAGDNYRRVVEKIQRGAIGKIKEAHVWLYGGLYQGPKFKEQPDPVPASLNWDLWVGPAAERDYYEGFYHPFEWRGWWDFGGGGSTDFGCHWVDLVHWALGLKYPHTVKATGPDPLPLRTSRSLMNEMWHTVPDSPAPLASPEGHVKVTWHIGGTHLDIANVYETYGINDKDPRNKGSKICFIGTEGILLSDYGSHHLLPDEKFAGYQAPERFIDRSIGHHNEWIKACKEGTPTTCNFDYSGALTEAILLGVAAHRAGNVEVKFDAKNLRITNHTGADALLRKQYRKGWEIETLV